MDGPRWHWEKNPDEPREEFAPAARVAAEIEDAIYRGFEGRGPVGIEEVRFERKVGDRTHVGEVVIVAGSLYPLKRGYFYMRMRTSLTRILALRDMGRLDKEVAKIRHDFIKDLEREKRKKS